MKDSKAAGKLNQNVNLISIYLPSIANLETFQATKFKEPFQLFILLIVKQLLIPFMIVASSSK